MRFLLFNVAVITALVYLFNLDRGDFDAAAGRLYEAAEGVQAVTRDAVERVKESVRAKRAPAESEARVDELPVSPPHGPASQEPFVEPAAVPVVRDQAESTAENGERDGKVESPPVEAPRAAQPKVVADPRPPVRKPAAPKIAAKQLPPVKDPAVARRRAEVLEGVARPGPTSSPAVSLAEGEQLMSPEQRVRELFTLAEEMELLFVSKMAR